MNVVKLHEEGTAKFVLMTDKDGNYTLKSDTNADFHREIVRTLDGRCLGGGRIAINDGHVHAYGYSVDFGTPSQEIVENLLNEHAKTSGLTVKVEMGRGY